jgi:ATP-dependent DNA ligase
LDGELISDNLYKDQTLSFHEILSTQKHALVIFDVLQSKNQDRRKESYRSRKNLLVQILPSQTGKVRRAEEYWVTTQEQLMELWSRGTTESTFHGIIAKQATTPYHSAGLSEGKWKVKNFISLDLVIIGYRISDKGKAIFMMAAWDEDMQKFVPIGEVDTVKAPDAMNSKILERCKGLQINHRLPEIAFNLVPHILVKPEIVLEIKTNGERIVDERYFNAGNSCLPPYDQGEYSERPDKNAADASTLADFLELKVASGYQERK